MSTSAINVSSISPVETSVTTRLKRTFSVPVRFMTALGKAKTLEKQAKFLYAMNDVELSNAGISRDEIHSYLAKSYTS